VIVLAVLAVSLNDSLTRLTGIKQAISFAANGTAAVVFMVSGHVSWSASGLMAIGSIAGGVLGGRLVGKVNPKVLQLVVVTLGTAIGLFYLWR
jgi:uncharacterized membrane protein YfcA